MQKNIQILINHFGNQKKTAKRLNITPRYLYDLKTGKKPGKFLKEKILSLVQSILGSGEEA